ncbi:MAG: type II secretion system protein GspM [Mariprofundaceae bacterium]
MEILLPWQARLRALFEAEVLPRYQQLEVREQRLVLAAAILLPLLLLIFGVILPIQDKQRALRADLVALQHQAAEAQQLASSIRQQGVSGKPRSSVNVLAAVERLARQFKLRQSMTRIRPQPVAEGRKQRLMLQMKNAPYEQVVRFTQALAGEHLGLNSLKIQQGKSPGLVHIQAVIEGG